MSTGRKWPPQPHAQPQPPTRPHRPQVLQPKVAAPPVRQTPVAPPVYRPQPVPKVLQRKNATLGQPPASVAKVTGVVAPPAYRPQPTPKVLQTKKAINQQNAAQSHSPIIPPRHGRPEPKGMTVQPKAGAMPRAQSVAAASAHRPPPQPPHRGRVIQREPDLNDMPDNVLENIASFLDNPGKLRMRETNQRFNQLLSPNVSGQAQPTPQVHHPKYIFGSEESAKEYPLDDWLMSKKDKEEAARFHEVIPEFRDIVFELVQAWNGGYSIIDPIVQCLSSSTGVVATTEHGKNPQPVGSYRIRTTVLQNGGNMLNRLLAAKHTLGLRHRDLTQMPINISICYYEKKTLFKKEPLGIIDWGKVLRCGRLDIREKLLSKSECAPGDWKLLKVGEWMQKAGDPVLSALFDTYKLLKPDGLEVTQTVTREHPSKKGKKYAISIDWGKVTDHKGIDISWNFSLGHLRFIVWTEWRLLEELLMLKKG
jgi:hypothetical protein